MVTVLSQPPHAQASADPDAEKVVLVPDTFLSVVMLSAVVLYISLKLQAR